LAEDECRQLAAALEAASEHPLARAFRRLGGRRVAEHVRSVPAAGMEGVIDGRRYRIGTAHFVAQLWGAADSSRDPCEGGSAVVLGDEQEALAWFELQDEARASTSSAVASLVQMRIVPQIVSGDSETAVGALAFRCGVQEYRARCTPEQKLTHVQTMQSIGHRVAMVGDGVNDAPVLGAADLAIAMGRGAALAQSSADMILVGDNLDAIPEAVRLARRMLRIARQNLSWSALYNFGSLPLAATGFIPPWLAAFGMSVSSVAVMLNAARLLPRRAATGGLQ
jgi:P-type Cu2+ transporter